MSLSFEIYLKERVEKISSYLKKNKIEAYRAYETELVDFPVFIDIYGKFAHIQILADSEDYEISEEKKKIIEKSIKSTLNISSSNQIWKIRKQQKGKSQYEKLDHSKNTFIVNEYSSKFLINLSDYLDTGLFLDHRETRQLVAELSRGKERLLNLFGYTGSFCVTAANAGVSYTTSVDMSNTYSDWARMNFDLNGMDKYKHIAIRENVPVFLDTALKKRWKYDVIVIDPPTFSNSKKMKMPFDIKRDYPKLINSSLELLHEKGILVFSTNFTKFKMNEDLILARKITDITEKTIPPDFSNLKIHQCFLVSKT